LSGIAHAPKVSSAYRRLRRIGATDYRIKTGSETALALVALLTRGLISWHGIVYRMRRWRTALRGNSLRAPQMQSGLTGDFGTETKTDTTVMASLVGQRAQRVALGMNAGSAARAPGHTGSGNNHDAHCFILAVLFCRNLEYPASSTQIRTSN
jgi:hypothetical protein